MGFLNLIFQLSVYFSAIILLFNLFSLLIWANKFICSRNFCNVKDPFAEQLIYSLEISQLLNHSTSWSTPLPVTLISH